MQTQKYEIAATEKQLRFIQVLQSRNLVDGEVDIDDLTKREASQIIDAGLAKAKRKALQEEEQDEAQATLSQRDEVDPIRYGLCVKLVYNKHEHGMANSQGVANFKKEVRQLYQIITDLEREF